MVYVFPVRHWNWVEIAEGIELFSNSFRSFPAQVLPENAWGGILGSLAWINWIKSSMATKSVNMGHFSPIFAHEVFLPWDPPAHSDRTDVHRRQLACGLPRDALAAKCWFAQWWGLKAETLSLLAYSVRIFLNLWQVTFWECQFLAGLEVPCFRFPSRRSFSWGASGRCIHKLQVESLAINQGAAQIWSTSTPAWAFGWQTGGAVDQVNEVSIPWFGQVLHVGLARAVLIKRPLEKVRDKYLALKIWSNSRLDHFTFSSLHVDSEVLSIFCMCFMPCCLLKLEGWKSNWSWAANCTVSGAFHRHLKTTYSLLASCCHLFAKAYDVVHVTWYCWASVMALLPVLKSDWIWRHPEEYLLDLPRGVRRMGHVALLPSHVLFALLQPDVDTTDALSSMSSGLYHSASRLHSNPGNGEFK